MGLAVERRPSEDTSCFLVPGQPGRPSAHRELLQTPGVTGTVTAGWLGHSACEGLLPGMANLIPTPSREALLPQPLLSQACHPSILRKSHPRHLPFPNGAALAPTRERSPHSAPRPATNQPSISNKSRRCLSLSLPGRQGAPTHAWRRSLLWAGDQELPGGRPFPAPTPSAGPRGEAAA